MRDIIDRAHAFVLLAMTCAVLFGAASVVLGAILTAAFALKALGWLS